MRLVLDASVIIKWFSTGEEAFQQEAMQLYHAIQTGKVAVVQPVHWQAEVIAVLTRLLPENIDQLIPLLDALEFKTQETSNIYQRAAVLSKDFNHHLFDTLYHAVALSENALLVTDDRKYFNKAHARGHIALLQDIDQHLS